MIPQIISIGKVSYALSEITGGFPEEIRIEDYLPKPKFLWSKLKEFKNLVHLNFKFIFLNINYLLDSLIKRDFYSEQRLHAFQADLICDHKLKKTD